MITGHVTAGLEARISLLVEDNTGLTHPIDATVDTGFSGYLSMPSTLIATLGFPWLCEQQLMLADGSVVLLNVYSAVVIWDGQPRSIRVNAIDSDVLVGMRLLAGNELRIRVVDGGLVQIDALP